MPFYDDKKDSFSEYPFHQGKPPIDPASLENITAPLRPEESSLKIIDHLLKNPDQYSFEKIRALADYLNGEKFARKPNDVPGALRFESILTTDPNPVITEPAKVHQGYRLLILQHVLDPRLVFKPTLAPEYLELESGSVLDSKLAKTIIRDTGEAPDSKYAVKKVIEWPIRISPGAELTINRDVFNAGYAQIQEAEKTGHSRFHEASLYLIGNNKSLGLIGNPLAIKMHDAHLKSDAAPPLKSGWKDTIEIHADSAHLKIDLQRNPGLIGHKSVTLKNEGNVPFILHFEVRGR
jgi:hypothetical protein